MPEEARSTHPRATRSRKYIKKKSERRLQEQRQWLEEEEQKKRQLQEDLDEYKRNQDALAKQALLLEKEKLVIASKKRAIAEEEESQRQKHARIEQSNRAELKLLEAERARAQQLEAEKESALKRLADTQTVLLRQRNELDNWKGKTTRVNTAAKELAVTRMAELQLKLDEQQSRATALENQLEEIAMKATERAMKSKILGNLRITTDLQIIVADSCWLIDMELPQPKRGLPYSRLNRFLEGLDGMNVLFVPYLVVKELDKQKLKPEKYHLVPTIQSIFKIFKHHQRIGNPRLFVQTNIDLNVNLKQRIEAQEVYDDKILEVYHAISKVTVKTPIMATIDCPFGVKVNAKYVTEDINPESLFKSLC